MAYSDLFLFLQSYCLQAQAKKKPPKMKVPVEISYLQKMQNDYERKKRVERSPQEHQERTISALHILFCLPLPIWISTCKNPEVGMHIVKIKGRDVCRNLLKNCFSPLPEGGNKDTCNDFSRRLPKTALVSCFWAALKEKVFSHPSQSVLPHLSRNTVKAFQAW